MKQHRKTTLKAGLFAAVAVATGLLATPAFATGIPQVPEPGSLTLLAAGIAGLIIGRRFWSRK